ncbi:MAG: hypothetical protein FWD90_07385 [Defluviitaleaceae bacterium]|nr:hypothetical protein [Defluviitaleaceae bacterium]
MQIKVSETIITKRAKPPLGINVNYLRDSDSNRQQARPLWETVKAANMGHVRYPGGEKSTAVIFFDPPYDTCRPRPTSEPYIRYSKEAEPMGFDEYIAVCKKAGCEPHVVVGCDSFERRNTTLDQYYENAVRWVRYANVEKNYGVKYWEIGNENWNAKQIPADEFGRIVTRFAKGMKEADPTIKIGASGKGDEWWVKFLPEAAENIDYLSVSEYACWAYMRYDTYANEDKFLLGEARAAVNAIKKYAPQHAERLNVVISEFNSRDYAGEFEGHGWDNENNLGHALVNIDMCGQIVRDPKIAYGMIWNTRWMDQHKPHNDIFYGFDPNNGLTPATMCLYLWGRFMREQILETEYDGNGVVCYASKEAEHLTVFLINKQGVTHEAELIAPPWQGKTANRYLYGGTEPHDLYPTFRQKGTHTLGDKISLPPYSLTVLEI